jgi:hypothetical protein
MNAATAPLLRVETLSKSFGDVQVLKGISFNLHKGESSGLEPGLEVRVDRQRLHQDGAPVIAPVNGTTVLCERGQEIPDVASSDFRECIAVRQDFGDLIVPLFIVPVEQVKTVEVGLDELPRFRRNTLGSDQREGCTDA